MRKSRKSKVESRKCKLKFKILSFLIFLITLHSALSTLHSTYAETVSSTELIENAASLDGKPVTYKGEAVKAVLNRGEHSWVNLNDGANAIGVWCKSSILKPVKFIGDYKIRGDILEVEGVFNRACPVHGGELDIHASFIRIVESGFVMGEDISETKTRFAIILFSIGLAATLIFRKRI